MAWIRASTSDMDCALLALAEETTAPTLPTDTTQYNTTQHNGSQVRVRAARQHCYKGWVDQSSSSDCLCDKYL